MEFPWPLVTSKYYGIYMTYPFKVSAHFGSPAGSSGSQMAPCPGAEFNRWVE
jgi:hypothetical protein